MAADEPRADKYFAFVSYAHADEKFAVRLARYLETYRVPIRLGGPEQRLPKRMTPIFRDRDEFAASADLGAAVVAALERSGALIVLCSPEAAASAWVNEEIRTFRRVRDGQRIFPVLLRGEPGEAFPPALIETGAEPLAVDFRPGHDNVRDARRRLVAGLLGVDFDALKRREQIRSRNARIRLGAIAAVLVAAFAVAGLQIANLRRVDAANHLADVSVERGAGDPTGAVLAAAAYDAAPGGHTAGAMLAHLVAAHAQARAALNVGERPSVPSTLAVLDHGELVADIVGRSDPADPASSLVVLDAHDLSRSSNTPGIRAKVLCGFDDAARVAVSDGTKLDLYDVPPRAPAHLAASFRLGGVAAMVCVHGTTVLVAGPGGARRADVAAQRATALRGLGAVGGIALSPAGRFAAFPAANGRSVAIVRTADGTVVRTLPRGGPANCVVPNCLDVVAFSPDERSVAFCSEPNSSTTVVTVASLAGTAARTYPIPQAENGCAGVFLFRRSESPPDFVVIGVRTNHTTEPNRMLAFDGAAGRYAPAPFAPAEINPVAYALRPAFAVGLDPSPFTPVFFATWAFGFDAPLLGDQPAPPWDGDEILARHAVIVAERDGLRAYDLDRYNLASRGAAISSAERLFDSGDGAHAAAFDSKSGRLRVVDVSPLLAGSRETTLLSLALSPVLNDEPQAAYDPDSRIVTFVSKAGLRQFTLDGHEVPHAGDALERLIATFTLTRRWNWDPEHYTLSTRGRYLALHVADLVDADLRPNAPNPVYEYLVTADGRVVAKGEVLGDFGPRFSPGDRFAATPLGLFRLPTMTPVPGSNRESSGSPFMALSSDERVLAYWTDRDRIQLYDLRLRSNIGPPLPALPYPVNKTSSDTNRNLFIPFSTQDRLTFTPDDRYLVVHHGAEQVKSVYLTRLAVYAVDPADWQRRLCIGFAPQADADAVRAAAGRATPCARFASEMVGGSTASPQR
jgi:MTH538 TIR-like domain (DUF1863)